jgi:hypothetical protein
MTLKTCVIRELERKTRLSNITPKRRACLMYFGHVERAGEEFFKLVRRHDLEGSVAKRSLQAIQPDSEPRRLNILTKIRNTQYSQWAGGEKNSLDATHQ